MLGVKLNLFQVIGLVLLNGTSINLLAREARIVRLNDRMIAKINLTLGRSTILSFSSKPSKVILGNRGNFGVEYVMNDVAVAPLNPTARSDLFIYLENERFAFDLVTGSSGGDEIVIVRDLGDRSLKVRTP
jgi:hypothetical protein